MSKVHGFREGLASHLDPRTLEWVIEDSERWPELRAYLSTLPTYTVKSVEVVYPKRKAKK